MKQGNLLLLLLLLMLLSFFLGVFAQKKIVRDPLSTIMDFTGFDKNMFIDMNRNFIRFKHFKEYGVLKVKKNLLEVIDLEIYTLNPLLGKQINTSDTSLICNDIQRISDWFVTNNIDYATNEIKKTIDDTLMNCKRLSS